MYTTFCKNIIWPQICVNKFSMFCKIKSLIKYFKNNSKNVKHNYFRFNYIKHSVNILSEPNRKLKIYRIFSLEFQNTDKIRFKMYLKLYDLFTSLLLTLYKQCNNRKSKQTP